MLLQIVLLITLIAANLNNTAHGLETFRKGEAVREAGLDSLIFSDGLLFQSPGRSKLACAKACLDWAGCVTFTFVTGTCRGHSSVPTSASPSSPYLGARTLVYRSGVVISWLETPCVSNGDCPAENSECFESMCLCTPGYFYSHGTGSCVTDCPESDLRTTYLKYPRSSIHPHEIDSDTGRTEQGCLDWCSAESWCRTCKFYSGTGTCYRFQITALDVAASEWIYVNDPSNIYQKSCA